MEEVQCNTAVFEEWVNRNLLRRWRDEKGFSLRMAAAELGVTFATVNHWERGRKVPRPSSFALIAALTGVPIEDLAGEWHRWLQERPETGDQNGSADD